jgi:uncharacterized protein YutE (UPF0331/DUF86 family)
VSIRPEVVLARLAHLGAVLDQLERLRRLTPAERADPLHRLALERALHVAAEVILDLGHHLLAGRGHAVPAVYREVVPALGAAGIFPAELVMRLEGLAGLGNLLVHDYADVDVEQLWSLAETRTGDLRAAQAALAALPELG